MTGKRKMLLLILSVPLGAMNGALAGFAFGFILALAYGWNPYFASMIGSRVLVITSALEQQENKKDIEH